MDATSSPAWISVADTAILLKVRPATIIRRIEKGTLPARTPEGIPALSVVMLSGLVCRACSLSQLRPPVAPFAPPVYVAGFHCYYEAIRLLTGCRVLSVYRTSIFPTTNEMEPARSPRYVCNTLCARHALKPRWNLRALAWRIRIAACDTGDCLGFHLTHLRG